MRIADNDDLREQLELTVMEMQEHGVAPSSIRRFVNSAIKAPMPRGDEPRSTAFLRLYWARERDHA